MKNKLSFSKCEITNISQGWARFFKVDSKLEVQMRAEISPVATKAELRFLSSDSVYHKGENQLVFLYGSETVFTTQETFKYKHFYVKSVEQCV